MHDASTLAESVSKVNDNTIKQTNMCTNLIAKGRRIFFNISPKSGVIKQKEFSLIGYTISESYCDSNVFYCVVINLRNRLC